MKIKLMNKIAKVGLEKFSDNYTIGEEVENPDGILVRSAALHDMEFNPDLKAIARAGAGVNNIPIDRCSEAGIVVFNTPGANANGVKELAVCALMLASRDIIGGIEWANSLTEDVAKQVEKGKSKFAGTEVKGKTIGVVGLGAIGGLVANAAHSLGMKVIGYDPFLSSLAAISLNSHVKYTKSLDDIYANADYISIHVPATPETKGFINAETIAKMKDGVKILNIARADLVNINDLKAALATGKVSKYITDFPTEDVINVPGIVATPHLGASTEEAEENCAIMAVSQIADYLENGNIKNSVNFPAVEAPRSGDTRICIFNDNVPDVLTNVSSIISHSGANIENLINKSRGSIAYTMIDITGDASAEMISKLEAISGVTKVRVIK